MFDIALKLLKIIESHGYKAYIVGGFARNQYLGLKSLDIDICTNAEPKDLQAMFKNSKISNDHYGSVSFMYEKIRFEITTFRRDSKYIDNRRPNKVVYIDDLKEDLLRRDFTINTLCIDSSGNVIDLLDVKGDLDNRIIKMLGNPKKRLKEDALRILRAVRFATVLDFELDKNLIKYIKKHGYLVNKLSSYRKKEELDKIFTSPNIKKGIKLLTDLNLLKPLDISNLKNIKIIDSLIGIWAQINSNSYQMTKHENLMIKRINELLTKDILDPNVLYHYGLYECEIAGSILNIERKTIVAAYTDLPIKSRKDIKVSAVDICDLLESKSGPFLKPIYNDIEYQIINKNLDNNHKEILNYILEKYKATK